MADVNKNNHSFKEMKNKNWIAILPGSKKAKLSIKN